MVYYRKIGCGKILCDLVKRNLANDMVERICCMIQRRQMCGKEWVERRQQMPLGIHQRADHYRHHPLDNLFLVRNIKEFGNFALAQIRSEGRMDWREYMILTIMSGSWNFTYSMRSFPHQTLQILGKRPALKLAALLNLNFTIIKVDDVIDYSPY